MAVLFGKRKSPKISPVPPPAAIPETAPETEEYAAKIARRRMGYRKTIITGALEPMTSGKKKLLG
jgi:hypothetical protein